MTKRHRPERTGYRVAVYVHECGAYSRRYVQADMPPEEYRKINEGRGSRAVMLSVDDWYANKLPEVIRDPDDLDRLVEKAEKKCGRVNV